MKPIYIANFVVDSVNEYFKTLMELSWLEVTSARKEYFMADETIAYTYGIGPAARTYTSQPFDQTVGYLKDTLNKLYDTQYNVCFLNRYDDAHKQLGWHADDSPEMNMEHDIAVISFGAEREIWWKQKDFKGVVPVENRQLLQNGSLFIMPAGFQKDHYHKIPKCDRACSTRISLTFRNYIKP
jgi:alkylated DNA repair dioxygenase AlkB